MYIEKPLSKIKSKVIQKSNKKYVVGSKMFTKFGSKFVSLLQNYKAMKTVPKDFILKFSRYELKSKLSLLNVKP